MQSARKVRGLALLVASALAFVLAVAPAAPAAAQGIYHLTMEVNTPPQNTRGWIVDWRTPRVTNAENGVIGQWYFGLEAGIYRSGGSFVFYFFGDNDGIGDRNTNCTPQWDNYGGWCSGFGSFQPGQRFKIKYEWCGDTPTGPGSITHICLYLDKLDGVGWRFITQDTRATVEMYSHVESFPGGRHMDIPCGGTGPARMLGQQIKTTGGSWVNVTGSGAWTRKDDGAYHVQNMNTSASPATWEVCNVITSEPVPPTPSPPQNAKRGDLNGDGKADVLAVYDGSGGMHWYPGKGDGGYWSARYIDQAGFKLMSVGDLNRDGKNDLLSIHESDSGLYWYPGKGDGTFWSARYLGQAGFRHMELADLNGDGILDMLAIYDGSGGLYWYPGKGDGSFWSARYIDQAGFKNMAVGDLNGDGKADLLAVYDGSLGLHWYPGKGDGTFWSARYISQAGFRHMELGDYNGDAKLDMLTIYDGSGGLHWYPGKGDGSFWSARYLDQAGFKLMATG